MLSRDYKGQRMPIRHRVLLPISRPKDKVPSSSKSTWEFVNISQPDRGKDAELRRSIRANAMRHYHSEQRARKRKLEHHGELCKKSVPLRKKSVVLEESDSSPTKAHSGCQSLQPLAVCHPNDAQSRNDRESRTFPYPCADWALEGPIPGAVGNNDLDPFNSLPVQDSPLDLRIFHHCKSPPNLNYNSIAFSGHEVCYRDFLLATWLTFLQVVNYMIDNWLPLGSGTTLNGPSFRTGWISTVFNDALLFRATTTYALMHHGSLGRQYSEAELSRRKMVTIKEINEQLNDPDKCLSNSTIGSIAMMASTEVLANSITLLAMSRFCQQH